MHFTENPVYVLGVLCLMVLASLYAGKTNLGKKVGPALLVILFTAILANTGLIPSASNAICLIRWYFYLYSSYFHFLFAIGGKPSIH